jgi:ABC-type multidrug transport system ATPase subunit
MASEIALTPDTYTPSIDDTGNYIDKIPVIKHGLLCLCGTRKDKRYNTSSKFSTHIKTKTHQNWLQTLNQNKANHYVKMLELQDLVENQRKIMGNLEKQLSQKNTTIDYLSQQLIVTHNQNNATANLLDIN